MDFKIVSRASTTVITVADLKAQIGLWGDDSYDLELASTLEAAQDLVEDTAGMFLRDTNIEQPLTGFNDLEIKHKKISWVKVKYINEAGTQVTMPASDYILDESGIYPRIVFKEFPATNSDYAYPVFIEYTAEPQDVPARVKHAVLVAGHELFEVRGESTEKARAKAEITIARLLGSYKRVVV